MNKNIVSTFYNLSVSVAVCGCATAPIKNSQFNQVALSNVVSNAIMDDLFWGECWTPGTVSTSAIETYSKQLADNKKYISLQVSKLRPGRLGDGLFVESEEIGFFCVVYEYEQGSAMRYSTSNSVFNNDVEPVISMLRIELGSEWVHDYISAGFAPERMEGISRILGAYVQWEQNENPKHGTLDLRHRFMVGPRSRYSITSSVLDLATGKLMTLPMINDSIPDVLNIMWIENHTIALPSCIMSALEGTESNSTALIEVADALIWREMATKILLFGKFITPSGF